MRVLSSKAVEIPSGRGETILIVEDDELVRKSVTTLVEWLGYRVLAARNGVEAVEILRQDMPIDLIFTDVVMPGGMLGPQLVAEARLLRPGLKTLYTSGYPEFQCSADGLAGSEELSKPYEPHELAAKLRDILDRVLLHGDVSFVPEDIEQLTTAFELALSKLKLPDRQDPLSAILAKFIIELANEDGRDPEKLCDGALAIVRRSGRAR